MPDDIPTPTAPPVALDQVVRRRAVRCKCEWCKTPLAKVRAVEQTDWENVRAVGYCPHCQTLVWSDPLPQTTPPNDQAQARRE